MIDVITITYLHEKYIIECLNSVAQQKTSFQINHYVYNDNSPDNSDSLLKTFESSNENYNLVYLKNQENAGAVNNLKKALENSQSKYIAILEGDDYWNDPLKLQKQVDFLESNLDYGLVHTNLNHFNEKTKEYINNINIDLKILSGDIFDFLLKPSHAIKTMTVFFRRDLFEKY